MTKKIDVIIVAAGNGHRFGVKQPKQLVMINDKPLLCHTARFFIDHEVFRHVVVVVPAGKRAFYEEIIETYDGLNQKRYLFVEGGADRYDSVSAGLDFIQQHKDISPDYVFIHDAARPCLGYAMINRLLDKITSGSKATIPVLPIADTLKQGKKNNDDGTLLCVNTLRRDGVYAVQTPQAFCFQLLVDAYGDFYDQRDTDFRPTDDAQLLQHYVDKIKAEHPISMVLGEADNIKLTYASDLERIKQTLGAGNGSLPIPKIKAGIGYDVHAFDANKNEIILGGMPIQHNRGLSGHSDADVVLHALVDALFGCIGEGDIGDHFPPTDPQWKDADSRQFLNYALAKIRAEKHQISNIDVTIIAEEPKLQKHKKPMASCIASLCDIEVTSVNVKATTSEKMGFVGRGEGIACIVQVVCVSHES